MKFAFAVLLCLPLALAARPDPDPEPLTPAQADMKAMQGEWAVVKVGGPKGKEKRADEIAKARFTFEKDVIKVTGGPRKEEDVKFTLDATKKPRWIDIIPPGPKGKGGEPPVKGIYKFEKGELSIAFTEGPRGERPTKFDDPKVNLLVLKRPEKKK
jgi:uncharacterized protein (TIGR03067 family)